VEVRSLPLQHFTVACHTVNDFFRTDFSHAFFTIAFCFYKGLFRFIDFPLFCFAFIFTHTLPLPAMGQKKLIRFTEIETFPNVLQYPQDIKGKWNEFFKNDHPITLELACGKGEYAVGLGRLYPQRNFIGIDLKGNRIWVGAKTALKESLTNVAFVRSQIDQVTNYFAEGEVSEIWITFPDPQLRASKHKKRLTHPKFLRSYQQLLKQGGLIHLKTDSPVLYRFTKEVISMYNLPLHSSTDDLYKEETISDELKIKTHYEGLDIAQSNRIHYLQFSLPAAPLPVEPDALLKQWVFENEKD
jgi:tRNA (guanine-N7-)-methyltransferase